MKYLFLILICFATLVESKIVFVTVYKKCEFCQGQGIYKCANCSGSGKIKVYSLFSNKKEYRLDKCDYCSGKGYVDKCYYCGGLGKVKADSAIEIGEENVNETR